MAEKFSRWRDQATGVQPFLYPLPPTPDASPALQLLLLPFKAVLGSIRILLVLLLLLAQALIVEGLLRVFDFVPGGYAAVTRSINASICRLILAVIGVVWINVETVQLRKTGRSPPQVPYDPKKGDVIVANSSSYLDLLYLVFRYNATLTLPVSDADASSGAAARIVGFQRTSLLGAILASGKLPGPNKNAESLASLMKKAPGPVVVFPECATSNNRALIKLADFVESATGSPGPSRIFVLTFRYPAPTSLAPSLTNPIPSDTFPALPLAHLYALTSRLVPYTFTVRKLHPTDSPKRLEWAALAETLAATARLKRVGALGWREKAAFLDFRRIKGR
ncbi:hypothetical protein JCM8202_004167 [Rhodotorula sphaerocarpa]